MNTEKMKQPKFNREYERLKTIGFIQIIFIILKLSGEVTWSWAAVLLPIVLKTLYEIVFLIIFVCFRINEERVNGN